MKSSLDFTWHRTADGYFVEIFPESPAAVTIWNQQIAHQTAGTGRYLAQLWPAVRAALQAAGYSLRKAGKIAGGAESDAELLKAIAG